MPEDYYKVLGVSQNATEEELRRAYRRLSRENHPDVKPDDKVAAERFKEVQEAWSVLGDSDKRKKYDQFGHAAFTGGGGPQGWSFNSSGSGAQIDLGDLFGGGGFADLFGGGFGGGQPRTRAAKGQDVQTTIEVPFTVACEGGGHDLTVTAGGKSERISIRIPAGVPDGGTIRLAGQGNPGIGGGPAGDLLVTVRCAPHPWFRREGSHLLIDVPVTMTEAALGAKVDVPTLTEGMVSVSVPPGSSSGTRLRLRGKGVPDRKTNERGDLFAVLKIVVPKELDDRSRDLLSDFAELNTECPRRDLWQ